MISEFEIMTTCNTSQFGSSLSLPIFHFRSYTSMMRIFGVSSP